MTLSVQNLFLSPGHAYFGRHGQEADDHPLIEVDELSCVAGRGLVGDRFFDFKVDYKGQITFFDAAVLRALIETLELADVPVGATRRNVITAGVDLGSLIGVEFIVQGVRFMGVEECRPCSWMNEAFGHDGAEAWLKGKGGLRARILSDGVIRRGPA